MAEVSNLKAATTLPGADPVLLRFFQNLPHRKCPCRTRHQCVYHVDGVPSEVKGFKTSQWEEEFVI